MTVIRFPGRSRRRLRVLRAVLAALASLAFAAEAYAALSRLDAPAEQPHRRPVAYRSSH